MPPLSRTAIPKVVEKTIVLAATATLKGRDNGARVILNSATAFTTTLPAPTPGMYFTFFVKVAAAATGHDILPAAATTVVYGKASPSGAALAGAAGKGRRNTQATSTVGDGLFIWSDGTDWYADPTGVWAQTP